MRTRSLDIFSIKFIVNYTRSTLYSYLILNRPNRLLRILITINFDILTSIRLLLLRLNRFKDKALARKRVYLKNIVIKDKALLKSSMLIIISIYITLYRLVVSVKSISYLL